jgi:hypothetical protein
MLSEIRLKLSNIKSFPAVAISIVLAFTLCLFGIYVIIPSDWLGIPVTTAYPNLTVRSIFGIFMSYPGLRILYAHIRYDLKSLVKEEMQKLRPYIFWMGVTYTYMCALRILIVGIFPPIFLLYLALAVITFIVWFSNRYV